MSRVAAGMPARGNLVDSAWVDSTSHVQLRIRAEHDRAARRLVTARRAGRNPG
jgi:hypothetical protein